MARSSEGWPQESEQDPTALFGANQIVRVGPAHVRLIGEFDISNSHYLQSVLEEGSDAASAADEYIVDCAQVTYMDSTTLHVLLKAGNAMGADTYLVIASPTPFVRRLLHVTGLASTRRIRIRDAG